MPSGVVDGGDAADMEDELLDPGQFLWAMSSTFKFYRIFGGVVSLAQKTNTIESYIYIYIYICMYPETLTE